jgi:glycosyltransferase involved in cell wall biosynthesis
MRTVIVSHAAIRASNRRVYRELARSADDVTVVVPNRWDSGLGRLYAEPEPENSNLRVVVLRRVGISHSNVYCLAGLDALIRKLRPDAIYVDEDPAGFAAAQSAFSASRYGAGLVVLAIQNLFKRYPAPFARLQRFVFDRTNIAVCTSDQAARILLQRGFQGTLVRMPFSTDLQPLQHDDRDAVRSTFQLKAPLVGFSGRLVHEKGVDVLLHAIAKMPDVNGAIIGDGPLRAKLQELAETLGIAPRVQFLGAQPPAQAAQLLAALDVLALPSRTMPNWAEQFGRVLIEAMASGVAVVASDSGAIGEVVGDAGLLVPEDDSNTLASALTRALGERESLAERGLDRVRRYYTSAVEAQALHEALTAAAPRATSLPSSLASVS